LYTREGGGRGGRVDDVHRNFFPKVLFLLVNFIVVKGRGVHTSDEWGWDVCGWRWWWGHLGGMRRGRSRKGRRGRYGW